MLKSRKIFLLFAIGVIVSLVVACNKKSDDDEEAEAAVTSSNVAVSSFTLTADDDVLDDLDSIFFAIDLEKGLIFNADSLPKGTDVSKLIPVITFIGAMTKADLTFNKDNRTDTTVNYLANTKDSIDFTYPVTLDVTAADGTSSFSYTIKVNVHQTDPDTLIWDRLASSILPSRFDNPVAQKTVSIADKVYCLIEEYNAQFTLSETQDLNNVDWEKTELDFNFTPITESFSTTQNEFFILDTEGNLYNSSDAINWAITGETWISIIGNYNNCLLGLKEQDGILVHTSYPTQTEAGFDTPIAASFPISGRSALGIMETKWATSPIAIFAGGVTESGEMSTSIWGFDGNTWETINATTLPALEAPMLAHYIVYRETPLPFKEIAFDAWLLFGGKTENGDLNNGMYVSLDNGVNWASASDYMNLSEEIPSLYAADILVVDFPMSTNIEDLWTRAQNFTRAGLSYTIEGYDILWQCPYLYIFGGYGNDALLSSVIWRGLLARLSFTTLI